MGSDVFVSVKSLEKKYGDFTALSDVSFDVHKGEIIGFLGPNGAGKTTTMKIITGYIPATKGIVEIAGMNIFQKSLECRKKIGYLPEDVPLYNDMKVTAYLKYVCTLRGVPKDDIPYSIDSMVEECDLEPVKGKLIRQLSKGNRQRVGLAQAMIHKPELLILDEPTVGLDPKQVVKIRELIGRFRKNHTVILSTHILSEVEQMCDRVIIINRGEIAFDRAVGNFRENTSMYRITVKAQRPEVELFLKEKNLTHEFVGSGDDESTFIADLSGMGAEAMAGEIVGKGWGLSELSRKQESLESVFLDVTMKN